MRKHKPRKRKKHRVGKGQRMLLLEVERHPEMLKIIHKYIQKYGKSASLPSKTILPNPNFTYRIVFKKGAVDTIKKSKGWRTDAEMARALGLHRSYITMLRNTKVSVTATVITRIAAQTGNIDGAWWLYYEIIPYGVIDPNHPVWNSEKEMGQIPYTRYSQSADMRSRDYKVETR